MALQVKSHSFYESLDKICFLHPSHGASSQDKEQI